RSPRSFSSLPTAASPWYEARSGSARQRKALPTVMIPTPDEKRCTSRLSWCSSQATSSEVSRRPKGCAAVGSAARTNGKERSRSLDLIIGLVPRNVIVAPSLLCHVEENVEVVGGRYEHTERWTRADHAAGRAARGVRSLLPVDLLFFEDGQSRGIQPAGHEPPWSGAEIHLERVAVAFVSLVPISGVVAAQGEESKARCRCIGATRLRVLGLGALIVRLSAPRGAVMLVEQESAASRSIGSLEPGPIAPGAVLVSQICASGAGPGYFEILVIQLLGGSGVVTLKLSRGSLSK